MNHEMNDGRMMWALVVGVMVGVAPVAMAAAQSAPAVAPPAPVEPEKKKQALPDLDDLLGIPSKPKAPAAGEGELPPEPGEEVKDSTALELERQLSAEEMAQKFDEAVRQMAESADRIEKAGDVGIATQRLHEAILRNLDVLIKQSQNNSSSSSSQQQKQQQQADQASQQKPTSQQQSQQPGQAENKGQENMPPEMVEAERKGRLETARAAWGNLPERVRESLLQGSSDYFSALYESMTEAYYKKIAEEGEE